MNVCGDKKTHIIERMMMCTYKYMCGREGGREWGERERGGVYGYKV